MPNTSKRNYYPIDRVVYSQLNTDSVGSASGHINNRGSCSRARSLSSASVELANTTEHNYYSIGDSNKNNDDDDNFYCSSNRQPDRSEVPLLSSDESSSDTSSDIYEGTATATLRSNFQRSRFSLEEPWWFNCTCAAVALVVLLIFIIIIYGFKVVPPAHANYPFHFLIVAYSDTIITLCYLIIPFTLLYFLMKRKDLPFNWAWILFSVFTICCGLTHFISMLISFNFLPLWLEHGISALSKFGTAVISAMMTTALIALLPALLKLPSPAMLRHQVQEKDFAMREKEAAERKLQLQYRQSLLMQRITQKIRNTLKATEIFEAAAEQVGVVFNVSRCTIHMYQQPNEGELGDLPPRASLPCVAEYLQNGQESFMNVEIPLQSDNFISQVLRTDYALAVYPVRSAATSTDTDTDSDNGEEDQSIRAFADMGVRSLLAVRTSYLNDLYGVILLHQCDSERIWSTEEIQMLEQVASQVGIAIQQAYLLEQETAQHHLLAMQNTELEKARLEAERANEAKGRYLAMISHEIRNPVNAIMGMISLLQEYGVTPEQAETVQVIADCCKHLLSVLNSLLDFSKIESGKIEIEQTRFNLHKFLHKTFAMLRTTTKKGVQLLLDPIDSALPMYVVGDKLRIHQCLVNLVSNAIKFTPSGSITIRATHLRTFETEDSSPPPSSPTTSNSIINNNNNNNNNNNRSSPSTEFPSSIPLRLRRPSIIIDTRPRTIKHEIQFDIIDTGIGIPKDRMDRLFKAFSQVDSSTTRLYGGTGLGLAISKSLAELMGGRIWATSQGTDTGSTFSFTVVVGNADPPSVNSPHLPSSESLPSLSQISSTSSILELTGSSSNNNNNNGSITSTSPSNNTTERSQQQQGQQEQEKEQQEQQQQQQQQGHKTRILLAEDNVLNQRVAVRLLAKGQYTNVDVVSDGKQAIDAVQATIDGTVEPYDVILMDVQMPNVDGPEATRRIRETLSARHLPQPYIIALTGDLQESTKRTCEQVGMQDFIAKPFKFDELMATLSSSRARGVVGATPSSSSAAAAAAAAAAATATTTTTTATTAMTTTTTTSSTASSSGGGSVTNNNNNNNQ